jgi:hypothetical protein
MMDTKGKNRKVFTLGYSYTQRNRGTLGATASSHVLDLQLEQASYIESNNTLCTAVKGNVYDWVTVSSVWDKSSPNEKYETTISVKEFDMSSRESTSAIVFQQKSKESLSVQSLFLSEGKFLVLIGNCQWGILEL